MQTSRFAGTVIDAARAELAVRERRNVERLYRRLLSVSDGVLGRLELRNLKGQRGLDQVTRRDVSRLLGELPPGVGNRFPSAAKSVQEALDATFEVQAELMHVLQRLLDRDPGPADSMDGARALAG